MSTWERMSDAQMWALIAFTLWYLFVLLSYLWKDSWRPPAVWRVPLLIIGGFAYAMFCLITLLHVE